MTSDIEARLRNAANPNGTASIGELWALCDEAADEIAALKAKLARATEGLREAGKAGTLLLANTIASIKKYQDPAFDENNLPGWLKDAEAKLSRAAAVLKELEE